MSFFSEERYAEILTAAFNEKNKKLCLISINSYNELTGGGVYLRTLVSFLQKQNVNLTLIDKKSSGKLFEDNTFQHISFIKGKRQDIISRLFLYHHFMSLIFSQ